MKINTIDYVAMALVIVGGINWGLVGALQFNLVDAIFGEASALSRIVYVLVGLSAIYMIATVVKLAGASGHKVTSA